MHSDCCDSGALYGLDGVWYCSRCKKFCKCINDNNGGGKCDERMDSKKHTMKSLEQIAQETCEFEQTCQTSDLIDVSLCKGCWCMTKIIDNKCGKCGKAK